MMPVIFRSTSANTRFAAPHWPSTAGHLRELRVEFRDEGRDDLERHHPMFEAVEGPLLDLPAAGSKSFEHVPYSRRIRRI
jgi:hypothetical protein